MTPRKQAAPAAPRPTRRHRRVLFTVLALLVLAAAGYAGLLWWAGGRMETALDDWAARARAQGWIIDYRAPTRRLDPLAASLVLPELHLEQGGLAWRAERVVASLAPWAPTRLRLTAEGAQTLALGGPPMPLAGSLAATIGLAADGDSVLEAHEAVLTTPAGPLRLEGGQVSLDRATANTAGLAGRLRGLVLPVASPLGNRLEEVTLEARLHGLPDGDGPTRAQATRWRDAGGRLEVMGLTLRWGTMAASAAATLALDAALQPSGAGTLRIANPMATLDALGAAGAVPPRNLEMAKRILPLMTRPDASGGPPVIELPVTLERRALGVMRMPLLQLPAVEW